MYASPTRRLSNGVMGVQDDVKPPMDRVNGTAEHVSMSNGVSSDLPFDSVEDTIEAFSTPC